jgi:DNA transposition AAA+ family ATPase
MPEHDSTQSDKAKAILIDELLATELPDGWNFISASSSFIPTSASKTILSRLKVAVDNKFGFAIVHGPAGGGKTITTRFFVEQGEHIYLRAHPEYSPPALLEEIAVNLRMTRVKQFRTLIAMVRDVLAARPRVIAIDEAQLANREVLETCKYLADETESTFILVTTDEFVSGLRRWRDIESRVGVVASIGGIPKKEFVELYKDSGFQNVTLEEIHHLAGGIMRDILRLTTQVDHLIGLNKDRGLERRLFSAAQVRVAAKKLNLSGGRS